MREIFGKMFKLDLPPLFRTITNTSFFFEPEYYMHGKKIV